MDLRYNENGSQWLAVVAWFLNNELVNYFVCVALGVVWRGVSLGLGV